MLIRKWIVCLLMGGYLAAPHFAAETETKGNSAIKPMVGENDAVAVDVQKKLEEVIAREKEKIKQYQKLTDAQLLRVMALKIDGLMENQKKQQEENSKLHEELRKVQQELKKLQKSKVTNTVAHFSLNEDKRDQMEKDIKAGLKALGKVEDDWTDEQVGTYLQVIWESVKDARSYSSNDYAILAIMQLGNKRIVNVIDFIKKPEVKNKNLFYFYQALQKMALPDSEENKKTVIDNIAQLPQLVNVVVAMKWEKDAKDDIVKALQDTKKSYVNWYMVQALANLKDKEVYPVLIDTLINKNNKKHVYKMIKDLPGIDLKDAVQKAWNNANNHGRVEFAGVAAGEGIYEALEEMIVYLANSKDSDWMRKQVVQDLYRLTGVVGDSKDYTKWYNENKDHIFFDKKKGRFVVDMKRKPRGQKEVF